jgi:hypothetical protein
VHVLHPSSAGRVVIGVQSRQTFDVHAHVGPPPKSVQMQLEHPSDWVSPTVHVSHAFSVQAQSPAMQEQVLHPSPAGFTSPSLQVAQSTIVHPQSPSSVQVHLLQPSAATRLSPGMQATGPLPPPPFGGCMPPSGSFIAPPAPAESSITPTSELVGAQPESTSMPTTPARQNPPSRRFM